MRDFNPFVFRKLDAGEQSLVKYQYGDFKPESFEYLLWQAIAKADSNNLNLLSYAYPLHVAAWRKYKYELDWWPKISSKLFMNLHVVK